MSYPTLHGTFPSMADGLRASVPLNNGVAMPWLGLGVYQMSSDAQTESCVRTAIEHGYRSIDTAAIYGNERGVGAAIRGCGVPREEIFATTKLWNDDMRAGRCEAGFEDSLRRLGLDYVDLYLLHWPIRGRITESWRALEKLHISGRIRAIGVSNHLTGDLDELIAHAELPPAVNQIEFHPWLQSPELAAYCEARDIRLEAWSPLMQGGNVLHDPVLAGIARQHGRSVAQIILRWDLQRGVVTIPKSSQEHRIVENADVFGFALSPTEMAAIDALDRNRRCGPDPADFSF